jgi:hypothetical protein
MSSTTASNLLHFSHQVSTRRNSFGFDPKFVATMPLFSLRSGHGRLGWRQTIPSELLHLCGFIMATVDLPMTKQRSRMHDYERYEASTCLAVPRFNGFSKVFPVSQSDYCWDVIKIKFENPQSTGSLRVGIHAQWRVCCVQYWVELYNAYLIKRFTSCPHLGTSITSHGVLTS